MNPTDKAALMALVDADDPVIRMIVAEHFNPFDMLDLPSGAKITGRSLQLWIEDLRISRYNEARDRYIAGTGTLDKVTDAVTPEVAARISADEHAAAKRLASERETVARAAEYARRRRYRHVTRATTLVRQHPIVLFTSALVVALVVVPWNLYGLDSNSTGVGVFTAYWLAMIMAVKCAIKTLSR